MVGELKGLRSLRYECNALAEAVEQQRANLRTATGDEQRTQDQVHTFTSQTPQNQRPHAPCPSTPARNQRPRDR